MIKSLELDGFSKVLSSFSGKESVFVPMVAKLHKSRLFDVISNCDHLILTGRVGKIRSATLQQFAEGINKEKCLGFIIID